MNKKELIKQISEKAGLAPAVAGRALDATLDSIIEAMSSGDNVSLVGFGNFEVRERSARAGRNPKTGEVIQIAASKAAAFKAGKALKDAVNGK